VGFVTNFYPAAVCRMIIGNCFGGSAGVDRDKKSPQQAAGYWWKGIRTHRVARIGRGWRLLRSRVAVMAWLSSLDTYHVLQRAWFNRGLHAKPG
jgi:hypothetical protein